MKAAYMLANAGQIDQFKALDEDALIEALDAAERSNPDDVVYIDDTWDAVHFLLCDNTTAQPLEGNALSEAIVGVNWFDEENEDAAFIAWSSPDDAARLHEAIRKIQADELPLGLEPKALADAEVYAADWIANEFEWACETLMHDFADLQTLYLRAKDEGLAVVVSFL